MIYLLDTHLLLWAKGSPRKLGERASQIIATTDHTLLFSVVGIWEVVIKNALDRPDFSIDGGQLRRGLLDSGFEELEVSAAHVLAVKTLPRLHGDPFDRLLIAQARSEGVILLTRDAINRSLRRWHRAGLTQAHRHAASAARFAAITRSQRSPFWSSLSLS